MRTITPDPTKSTATPKGRGFGEHNLWVSLTRFYTATIRTLIAPTDTGDHDSKTPSSPWSP
jgi:hypothetical protein